MFGIVLLLFTGSLCAFGRRWSLIASPAGAGILHCAWLRTSTPNHPPRLNFPPFRFPFAAGLFLAAALLLSSCSQQAPTPSASAALTISAAEVKIVLDRAGLRPADGYLVSRQNYRLVSREWLREQLAPQLGKYHVEAARNGWDRALLSPDVGPGEPAFKCTEHAALASILARSIEPGAAVGSVWFLQDDGKGHAINIALVPVLRPRSEAAWDRIEIIYWEPQRRHETALSDREKERSIAWMF